MATNIETLIKPNGDQVLPRTRAKAVSMEDGTTVEAAIMGLNANIDALATESYVDTKVSRLVRSPEVAEVGQILSVTEVDEDGRPIAWEATDIALNPDKPSSEIDLEKYGITKGNINHKAPYSEAEWKQAYDNFEGIKTALADMAANGQTNIMLPKGTYVVCYQNPTGGVSGANYGWEIVIPSHVTFDLNGSTIRVIFDSDNRNPYDKSNLDPYKLNGKVFAFSQSYHSAIRNGIILGDRYERSFINANEKNHDQTYGILMRRGSAYCTIQNMEISGFMGDSVMGGFDHDPDKGSIITSGTQILSSLMLDGTTGAEKAGLGDSFVSDYYDLSPIVSVDGYEMAIDSNHTDKFAVFFYDQNKAFVSYAEYEPLDNIPIPNGAMYCRLMTRSATAWEANADTLELNYSITPPKSQFLTIDNCKFYNNNRGGLSNLPHDTTVTKCELFENGTAGTEGFPVFGDSTRYAINCEDVYCRKLVIKDNYFHDGFHCLLMSVSNLIVDGNKIHNFKAGTGGCLNLMHFRNAVFTNNVVENSATPNIDTRIIAKGLDSRHVVVANNIFKFCTVNMADCINLYENVFQFERISVNNSGEKPLKNLTMIEDKSIATAFADVHIRGAFKDCTMSMRQKLPYGGRDILYLGKDTSNLVIEYIDDAVKREYVPMSVYGAEIRGGALKGFDLNDPVHSGGIVIEDSTIEPGNYSTLGIVQNDTSYRMVFNRSKIIMGKTLTPPQFIYSFKTDSAVSSGVSLDVSFEDCVIDWYSGNNFISFMYMNFANVDNCSIVFAFRNCTFNNHTDKTIPIINTTNTTGLNDSNYHVTWENNTLNGNWAAPVQLS